MPTTLRRARRWINTGKVSPFWKKGIFCVRLNQEPSNNEKQEVCVGLDPGSKREAYTIKSTSHTYLNVLSETVDWVKDAVKVRRIMRRARRQRNTRYRPARFNNRISKKLAPSTKSRWQLKLNNIKWLMKLFPITSVCVEDIKAKTKPGKRKWNVSFSPLEHGKSWFYNEVKQLCELHLRQGYETKEERDRLGLKKSSSKLADKFECHNVDSWVLSNMIVGGHDKPENTKIMKIVPLRFHRRQLHVMQYSKGNKRRNYGGTRSMGLKRGSLVKHKKYGLCYVGGTMNNKISLHNLSNGHRITKCAKVEECEFRTYLSYRSTRNSPNE